jgi:hypothetical protein
MHAILQIEPYPEVGEGCLKLTCNGLMISAFTPGSECEANIRLAIKGNRSTNTIEVKPVEGLVTMWLIPGDPPDESQKVPRVVEVPRGVYSLHINDLPINVFRLGSNVHMNMQLCFPEATYR